MEEHRIEVDPGHPIPLNRWYVPFVESFRSPSFDSASSPLSRLPVDLAYCITLFLRGDAEALRSTSLVSRIWHSACRPLILYKVTLRGDKDDLGAFEDFLRSDPHVGHFIKAIHVRFPVHTNGRGMARGWVENLPKALHKKIPNIHTLELEGLGGFYPSYTKDFFDYLPLWRSLKRLEIVRCCLQHGVLNTFLDSLPALEVFHVHNHWVDASGSPPEPFNFDVIPSIKSTPSLTEFSYHNDDGSGPPTHAFLGWLSSVQTLKTVRIHVTAMRSLPEVGRFLRSLGRSLEHLELRFLDTISPWSWEDGSGDGSIRESIDLTENISLRTIHLHNVAHPSFEFILRQTANLPVQTVIFTEICTLLDCYYDEHDRTLDSILSVGFKDLKEVCVVFRGIDGIDRDIIPADWAKVVFPTIESRCMVQVMQSDTETDLCCIT